VLHHDLVIQNEQLDGSYQHIYKMLRFISVFRTVHHSSPSRAKEKHPHIPKLLLQNTFDIILPLMAVTSKKSVSSGWHSKVQKIMAATL
jgi:hypothetical protein